MGTSQAPEIVIEHVEGSSPATFKVTRLEDGKSLSPVAIASPYEFPVEGRPNSKLMQELRWYLEQFLDYPFRPETDHADHVLDALRAWGTHAFNVLFDGRDAEEWLDNSAILQVRGDDPQILSWPWEALFDPRHGRYLALHWRLERRLNQIPDAQPAAELPKERVNILLVVCRPYENDVRYRSLARPLIELIRSNNLPAHVDVLRPPTFSQLREHLQQHRGYYHVLHFDGHGAYGPSGYGSPNQFRAHQGYLIFESESCGPDPKSEHDLSALLHECGVPVAVLNACRAGALDEHAENAFASVATALLRSGIRSVVAMAYSLYVSGAQVFLPAFYRRLFESGSVAEGVRAGRQEMLADKNRMSARGSYPLEDWLLPVLYQQVPLDFAFAGHGPPNTSESRLPKEIQERREAYGFIGRDGSILQMERALYSNKPCILVHGLGGVGKTTLARGFLRWLDETGGLDAALWFDFRDIRTAEYVFNRTGEVFYGKNFAASPTKLDLLADASRRHRVLMVWDNFESAAQNLPSSDRDELGRFLDAIRGTQSKVIITTRSPEPWLEPTRYFDLPLRGLAGEERWDYCEVVLRELGLKVNREDPALKELVDQLAGHPVAMRVVLPRLEHMPAAKVKEALHRNIAELDLTEQDEANQLFGTLRFVERGIPQELRPMLGLIALHKSYFYVPFLEQLAEYVDPNWTPQNINQLVSELLHCGLVQRLSTGLFEIHPLLTNYLRAHIGVSQDLERAFVYFWAWLADNVASFENAQQRMLIMFTEPNFRAALGLSQALAIDEACGAFL
jgi:hypothetical protein